MFIIRTSILLLLILGSAFSLVFALEYDCKDSDAGLDQFKSGFVSFGDYEYIDTCAKGYEGVSQVNNIEAVRGDIIEYSCLSEKGDHLCSSSSCLFSVLKCSNSQICKEGRCMAEKQNHQKYCNDASCYIIEDDILGIEFIDKTELNDGCLVKEKCSRHTGKYSLDKHPIQSYVELKVGIDFVELKDILQKKFGVAPQMKNSIGGDNVSDSVYMLEKGEKMLLFWISDKKLISVDISKKIDLDKENDHVDAFFSKYLELHPSDSERSINFFERIYEWLKNLFR